MPKGPNSLDFILLGLLSLRPSTGYDLKKMMDISIRFISPVALSQIYPTLKQMTAQELVTFRVEERDGKPNLKIYSITEAGQALFLKMLAEPYSPDQYRFDYFTLRFYFSSLLDKPTLLNHIRTELAFRKIQLETARNFDFNNLGDLNPVEAVDMERTVKFWELYHQYGLQFMETYTRWLEHILQLVEQGL
jgi:PadR family transcriptional regulator, regulatory protein AphA